MPFRGLLSLHVYAKICNRVRYRSKSKVGRSLRISGHRSARTHFSKGEKSFITETRVDRGKSVDAQVSEISGNLRFFDAREYSVTRTCNREPPDPSSPGGGGFLFFSIEDSSERAPRKFRSREHARFSRSSAITRCWWCDVTRTALFKLKFYARQWSEHVTAALPPKPNSGASFTRSTGAKEHIARISHTLLVIETSFSWHFFSTALS